MNLTQALELVREHIRIGKGMRLTSGVPEALEMVVEELEVTQKALELACEHIGENDCPAGKIKGFDCGDYPCEPINVCWKNYFIAQAKAGEK